MGHQFTAMPPEDLRQIQLLQLEMLLEVDRICKKNKIKYNISYGTLLGAVRHQGFIPWDDDADVTMLRAEYEKFCKVCERELDSRRFYLQNHVNTPGYRWGYGKIRRVGTEYVREGQEHLPYRTGVFIDIFPLDFVPDNGLARRFHHICCTIIRKLQWSEVGKRTDSSAFMRSVYRCLSWIPRSAVFKMYDALRNFSNRKPTTRVRTLTFPTPNNGQYGFDCKWFNELAEVAFEGHRFPATRDFDDYLTFTYGNYLELPPVEKRKGHPATRYKLLESE
ncbi:phosphorylcholine transferase LicD [Paenibacillaceae bacterium WGS1546]|uniref:LicD family protein n=1 Tax=Cohnella sp. WGS1546 TaxID=3366810 RepID=UPI00372D7523